MFAFYCNLDSFLKSCTKIYTVTYKKALVQPISEPIPELATATSVLFPVTENMLESCVEFSAADDLPAALFEV